MVVVFLQFTQSAGYKLQINSVPHLLFSSSALSSFPLLLILCS